MPTSGSYNFSIDTNDIVEGALRLTGIVGEGKTPTADQYTAGYAALNMMAKAWQTDGLQLWAMEEYSLTMTASQITYTLGEGLTYNVPKPIRIIQAFLRNTAGSNDTPMRIITRDEYNRLGNKSTAGLPVQLFYEPQLTSGTISLFPVPDTTAASDYTITIIYQRPFADFDSATDNPDFPQEWYEALKYGLAVRLAGEYQVESSIRKALMEEASLFKQQAMLNSAEEGSFYFGIERRGY